jgi:hypothetical protein
MEDARDGAVREAELLLETAKQLRATLRESERLYRQTLRGIERGSRVTETIQALGVNSARGELTEAVKSFERQRHRTRVAFIAAQLAEGESIGAVGRSWGFSRQLASVYASEAREAFGT